MQVIRETDRHLDVQPGTNLKHVELHGREVGILLACYCPSELRAE